MIHMLVMTIVLKFMFEFIVLRKQRTMEIAYCCFGVICGRSDILVTNSCFDFQFWISGMKQKNKKYWSNYVRKSLKYHRRSWISIWNHAYKGPSLFYCVLKEKHIKDHLYFIVFWKKSQRTPFAPSSVEPAMTQNYPANGWLHQNIKHRGFS